MMGKSVGIKACILLWDEVWTTLTRTNWFSLVSAHCYSFQGGFHACKLDSFWRQLNRKLHHKCVSNVLKSQKVKPVQRNDWFPLDNTTVYSQILSLASATFIHRSAFIAPNNLLTKHSQCFLSREDFIDAVLLLLLENVRSFAQYNMILPCFGHSCS